MKTKTLIIISLMTVVAISLIFIVLAYNQEIKLFAGMTVKDDNSESHRTITDPLCFAVPNTDNGELCYSLDTLEGYGCSKPILEHLAEYSTLINYEWQEMFIIEWVSLPKGISEKQFDECVGFLNKQRRGSNETIDSILSNYPLNDYSGKDCSSAGILNKTCFIDSFTKCIPAQISKNTATIEGGIITTSALVNSTNPDMCKIDVYRDTLQDKYSEQTINHYSCSLIIDSGDSLKIGKCLPLEHDRPQIFVFDD